VKFFAIFAVVLVVWFPGQAQNLGEEYHQLNRLPWNGDWMPDRVDDFVHGQEFLGYPGPLPKMFFALGSDANHPGVEYELLTRVNRDAPYWYGTCNGWAGATLMYPEPDAVVINGVKLFSGEVKAILSAVWKDSFELIKGGSGGDGLGPKEFEEILYEYIAANRPIIFDVAVSDEKWNYPVSAFRRTAVDAGGGWTNVTVDVYYTDTRKLIELMDIRETGFFEATYTYRISPEGFYEWTGTSGSIRPDRAWLPGGTYFWGLWLNQGNRFWDESIYEKFQTMSAKADADQDLFEPNNEWPEAVPANEKLIIASVEDGNEDWYLFEKRVGEPLSFQIKVYDGVPIDYYLYDKDGGEIESQVMVDDTRVTLDPELAAPIRLEVVLPDQDSGMSFYHLLKSEDQSWYRHPFWGADPSNAFLTAIIVSGDAGHVAGEYAYEVAPGGSKLFDRVQKGAVYRADTNTIWAAEQAADGMVYKKYAKQHQMRLPYVVPHLTFRNDWNTLLHLTPCIQESAKIEVFNAAGDSLGTREITPEKMAGTIDLSAILTAPMREQGAWFTLSVSPLNTLAGYVTYAHAKGYRAYYDIEGRPRHSELVVGGLPQPEEGWVGLSLVNVSGVENQILYRLSSKSGKLSEGSFLLAPGQKWLGTPTSLTGLELNKKDLALQFFAQYPVASLALQCDHSNGLNYARHIPSYTLDGLAEGQQAYLALPHSDPDTVTYKFENINNRTNWIKLEGFSEAGELQGTVFVGKSAINAFEARHITLTRLLSDMTYQVPDPALSYFRVTSQRDVFIYELTGLPGRQAKYVADVPKVFPDP